MATCGLTDDAFQVFLDMSKRRVEPDVNTFTSLLSACARDGEEGIGRVAVVWSEMGNFGVRPDLFCFNALLRCLKQAGIPGDMKLETPEEIGLPDFNLKELHATFDSIGEALDRAAHSDVATAAASNGPAHLQRDRASHSDVATAAASNGPAHLQRDRAAHSDVATAAASNGPAHLQRDRAAHSDVATAAASNGPAHLQSDQIPKPNTDLNSNNRFTTKQSNRTIKNVSNESSDTEKSGRYNRSFSESGKSGKFIPKKPVLSQSRVHLRLPPPVPLPLTIEISGSGCRWMGAESVEKILGAMEDAGLTPDVHTLHLLSQLAGDWVGVVRRVGVSKLAPDERSILAAVRLQSHLGNTGGAEVRNNWQCMKGASVNCKHT